MLEHVGNDHNVVISEIGEVQSCNISSMDIDSLMAVLEKVERLLRVVDAQVSRCETSTAAFGNYCANSTAEFQNGAWTNAAPAQQDLYGIDLLHGAPTQPFRLPTKILSVQSSVAVSARDTRRLHSLARQPKE